EIAQSHEAAAGAHQRCAPATEIGEGVAGDLQATQEIGPGSVDVAAFQLIWIGECDRMHDEIESLPILAEGRENAADALLVGYVAVHHDLAVDAVGERTDALAQRVALEGEGELGALRMHRLGDAPSD